MICKIRSIIIFIANLTLNHDLRTFFFYMLKQFSPRHMLKILVITNVTTKFGTFVHRMLLQLIHRFPNNFAVSVVPEAPVREFAKIYAVGQNFVNVVKEISLSRAVWADHFELLYWVQTSSWFFGIRELIFLLICALRQLNLTIFAKQLIAFFALQRLVRKI